MIILHQSTANCVIAVVTFLKIGGENMSVDSHDQQYDNKFILTRTTLGEILCIVTF